MSQYLLSTHSFVCETDGYAIFLDLKRDKYVALQPDDVSVVRPLVRGWPALRELGISSDSQIAGQLAVIETLLGEGLLTTDESQGKDASPAVVEPVTRSIHDVRGYSPVLTPRDLRRFVRAWVLTTVMLRFLPLSYIVRRVMKRKMRRRHGSTAFDALKAHRLRTAYFILRPNFFSAKDACLRDSLTFIEFFALHDLFPTWVIGVRMRPFRAHSWVQAGSMVLNDDVTHVTRFAPILAV